MNTTHKTILEKGSQITICPECRHVINTELKDRPAIYDILTIPNVLDIGLECPFCQHWTHSYFINNNLLQRALKMDNKPRQVRRQFSKDFKKFQKKMKGVLKQNTQNVTL